MLAYLGWIAAAFMAGMLFAGRMKNRRPPLQAQVEKAGYFRGKSYKEILREISAPQTVIRQTDGRTLRIWQEKGYGISLLFDARDLCLGVESEQY
jgi:hypothetical protein